MNYTHAGTTDSLKGWAKRLNISYTTLFARVKKLGWTFERAISQRVQEQVNHEMGTKRCSKCKLVKNLDQFSRLTRRGGNEYTAHCKECDRERCKTMREQLRLLVLSHYSGGKPCCSICGEKRLPVLDLDHIHGNGNKDRREFGNPWGVYRNCRDNQFPDGFRVLCRNCNWIEYLRLKSDRLDDVH